MLPKQWKIGKVTPLFKTGSRNCPCNYRPISLTSNCCKILEHIIYTNLVNFLESNLFFSTAQHGFRKSYSCETQLICFTHKLHQILDRSSHADCIFLDFSKAFDKVSHRLLLHKLNGLNLDNTLLKWIEFFLTNRSQFVVANQCCSGFSPVVSGVPQGSVLGPLLFLIYINDMASLLKSNVLLFADDCVVFREITSDNDANLLQSDLNAVANWSKTWLMELNTKKCKVMRISRTKTVPPPYYLNSVQLESVASYKYLGIHITTNLTWNLHTEHVISNANRMLGYLRRNFYQAPSSLKLTLYKTLIRPKMEYACSIWDPSQDKLVNALELVQNNSVRFILSNYNRTASITAMKSNLAFQPLSVRRQISRLTLFHKLYYHPVLHDQFIATPHYRSHRIDHNHKVGIDICNTKHFFHSFLPKTSREWNRLPSSAVCIADNEHFRNILAKLV